MSIAYQINNILFTKSLVPTDLAFLLQVKIETVVSWLRGWQDPSLYNALSIARLFPDHEKEIFDSLMQKQFETRDRMSINAGGTGAGIYLFSEELERFISKGAWWSNDRKRGEYDVDLMNYVLSIRDKYKTHKIIPIKKVDQQIESQLFLLPTPKILIVSNWNQLIEEIANRKKEMHSLTWIQFEDLIGRLLENFGWKISSMNRTKDDGIDLIATQFILPDVIFNMMVQCKKYYPQKKVGLSIVKEVWSTKWEHGFHQAMIATSSDFTRGAKKSADKWNFELRNHNDILDWCKKYGKEIK